MLSRTSWYHWVILAFLATLVTAALGKEFISVPTDSTAIKEVEKDPESVIAPTDASEALIQETSAQPKAGEVKQSEEIAKEIPAPTLDIQPAEEEKSLNPEVVQEKKSEAIQISIPAERKDIQDEPVAIAPVEIPGPPPTQGEPQVKDAQDSSGNPEVAKSPEEKDNVKLPDVAEMEKAPEGAQMEELKPLEVAQKEEIKSPEAPEMETIKSSEVPAMQAIKSSEVPEKEENKSPLESEKEEIKSTQEPEKEEAKSPKMPENVEISFPEVPETEIKSPEVPEKEESQSPENTGKEDAKTPEITDQENPKSPEIPESNEGYKKIFEMLMDVKLKPKKGGDSSSLIKDINNQDSPNSPQLPDESGAHREVSKPLLRILFNVTILAPESPACTECSRLQKDSNTPSETTGLGESKREEEYLKGKALSIFFGIMFRDQKKEKDQTDSLQSLFGRDKPALGNGEGPGQELEKLEEQPQQPGEEEEEKQPEIQSLQKEEPQEESEQKPEVEEAPQEQSESGNYQDKPEELPQQESEGEFQEESQQSPDVQPWPTKRVHHRHHHRHHRPRKGNCQKVRCTFPPFLADETCKVKKVRIVAPQKNNPYVDPKYAAYSRCCPVWICKRKEGKSETYHGYYGNPKAEQSINRALDSGDSETFGKDHEKEGKIAEDETANEEEMTPIRKPMKTLGHHRPMSKKYQLYRKLYHKNSPYRPQGQYRSMSSSAYPNKESFEPRRAQQYEASRRPQNILYQENLEEMQKNNNYRQQPPQGLSQGSGYQWVHSKPQAFPLFSRPFFISRPRPIQNYKLTPPTIFPFVPPMYPPMKEEIKVFGFPEEKPSQGPFPAQSPGLVLNMKEPKAPKYPFAILGFPNQEMRKENPELGGNFQPQPPSNLWVGERGNAELGAGQAPRGFGNDEKSNWGNLPLEKSSVPEEEKDQNESFLDFPDKEAKSLGSGKTQVSQIGDDLKRLDQMDPTSPEYLAELIRLTNATMMELKKTGTVA